QSGFDVTLNVFVRAMLAVPIAFADRFPDHPTATVRAMSRVAASVLATIPALAYSSPVIPENPVLRWAARPNHHSACYWKSDADSSDLMSRKSGSLTSGKRRALARDGRLVRSLCRESADPQYSHALIL